MTANSSAREAPVDAAGLGEDKKARLFRTSCAHASKRLGDVAIAKSDPWRMVRKRALAAGKMAPVGIAVFGQPGSPRV